MKDQDPKLLSNKTSEPLKTLQEMSDQELKNYLAKLENSFHKLRKSLGHVTPEEFMREKMGLKTPSHILKWLMLLQTQKEKPRLIEASRDHGKSWTFSFSWPLYRIYSCRNPIDSFGIALFSYSEKQAKKNVKRIRQKIEATKALQWLKPPKSYSAHVWDSETLDCSNGCSIEAYGFGSAFRGRHPRLIVIDDPCKDRGTGAMSLEEQEQFFYGVIIPAARRGCQIVITGNPVDKIDFLKGLEDNPEIDYFLFPCWNDKREPLWPEEYTIADLEAKQRLIPPHIFAREYLLKRVASDKAKFKEKWIKYYNSPEIDGRDLYKVMTIDPVPPPNPGMPQRDALAAVVTGTDKNGYVYVLDHMSFRGDLDEGMDLLVDMMVNNEPDFIGDEIFGFQSMHKVWLEEKIAARGYFFTVEEIGKNSKRTKASRIESVQPKMIQGKLRFRQEDKPIIDQYILWDPISKTNDDDLIDALGYQVAIWDTPFEHEDAERVMNPNSFEAAVIEVQESNSENQHYLTQLFSDMHDA